MKKSLTLLAATTCISVATHAQSFTNAGMESWHNFTTAGMTLQAPNGWTSFDSLIAALGTGAAGTFHPALKKETIVVHSGSAAARVETKAFHPGDTLEYFYGGFGNEGTPVSNRIEKVSAWLQYAAADPDDKGVFSVTAIKKNSAADGGDSVVGSGRLVVAGTGGVYVQHDCYITYDDAAVVPDLISVSFMSCGGATAIVAAEGSTLYVDDVTMRSEATGIETPLFTGETINIYPNPATDVLHISTSVKTATRFSVYSVTGRLI